MTADLSRIGRTLYGHVDALAVTLADDLLATVASPVSVPRDQLWRSIWANLSAIARFLVAGGLPDEWDTPADALDFARLTAHRGIPESSLVMFYHRAQNLFDLELLDIVERELADDGQADSPFEVLTQLRTFTSDYMRKVIPDVRVEYQAELARRKGLGDPETLRLVRDVLNESLPAPAAVGEYGLEGRHVGVVVRTAEREPFDAFEVDIVRDEFVAALGADGPPLVVHPDALTVWMWFRVPAGAVRPPNSDVSDIAVMSIGMVSTGVEGFRATHRRARACDQLGKTAGVAAGQVVSDFVPGTTAARGFADDPRAAREIVATVLGGLASGGEEVQMLRATARAYLEFGPTEAARHLVVHRNTVKYRIDRIRDMLGQYDLGSPDVALALELERWFGVSVSA